jgi:predicted small lipoprotein YifL
MRRSTTILALLALAACGRDAPVPTSEENAQMEDAANLLDQAPDDLEAIDDGGLNAADANTLS